MPGDAAFSDEAAEPDQTRRALSDIRDQCPQSARQIALVLSPWPQQRQRSGASSARPEQTTTAADYNSAQDAAGLHSFLGGPPCWRRDGRTRGLAATGRLRHRAAARRNLHLKALGGDVRQARTCATAKSHAEAKGRPSTRRDLRVSARLRRRHGENALHAPANLAKAQLCQDPAARARDRRPRPVPAPDGRPESRARALPRSR